ncbi:hypothetical protein DA075_31440 [Methylobacterium currus]|uniref:Uncharacterized protein n=1 Tax=Methylobacterium currus TaxID=2051553 RepID=A0A2R4WV51_9HYPH|nr:hypothetical protein [Methylobacterium currus]AWB25411.1 hypothetical protein DA075_31440 [Methylobacterium currus]UHC19796.1 hypothetical protein LRS73_30315 [Methylobacterium currus]
MAPQGNLQGNLLARAEAVVERAFRIAAEHQATLAQARKAVQPLREAAARQDGGVPYAPDTGRPRKERSA